VIPAKGWSNELSTTADDKLNGNQPQTDHQHLATTGLISKDVSSIFFPLRLNLLFLAEVVWVARFFGLGIRSNERGEKPITGKIRWPPGGFRKLQPTKLKKMRQI